MKIKLVFILHKKKERMVEPVSIELIVACDRNYGIGLKGIVPWHCSEELQLFKTKTMDSILIMGRKTVETLPLLKNRTVICLSRSRKLEKDNNKSVIVSNMSELDSMLGNMTGKRIFIAGGAEMYKEALKNFGVSKIHISIMKNESKCDTFFPAEYLSNFVIEQEQDYSEFTHRVLKYVKINRQEERQYLNLLKKVLQEGSIRVGRNGETKSLFFEQFKFDLRRGFPLLTTKKMFFRGIVEELLFFIRGDTNSKLLEEKGINIWKPNTRREFLDSLGMTERQEGILGQMYGYQWRFFNAKYDENNGCPLEAGIDQLQNVVDTIRKDPYSRRILLTDYNPCQASQGVLYPCHSIINQFYVEENYLDMFCFNRSQDLFLGTPFNIASSALLLSLIAKITGLIPRFLCMSLGDTHLYKQHYEVARSQLERPLYMFPTLVIKEVKELADIEKLEFSDFILVNYLSHPAIKADMVV